MSLEALDQRLKHNIYIWGHKEHRSDVSKIFDALVFVSLIGSFVKMVTLLFWLFWNH